MTSAAGPSSIPKPKMMDITIHRCSDVPTDTSRKSYFVKATIGSKTMKTKKRKASQRQVVWDQELSFGDAEATSIMFELYRLRTLPCREPELAGRITVNLTETPDAGPQSNPRTLSFPEGPMIEFSLNINEIRDVIEQAQQAQTVQPLEGVWKRLVEGLGMFCEVTGPVAGVNSFAELAHGILSSMSKPLSAELERNDQMGTLLNSFTDFFDLVNESRHSIITASDELKDVLKRISLQMVEVALFVRDYYESGKFLTRALKNIISATDETIQGYTSTLEGLKEELQFRLGLKAGATIQRVEVTVVRVLEQIKQISQFLNLDDLAYARGAGVNQDKICLPGTRTNILRDMAQWAVSDGSRMLLLFGGAGTGKSAIAHTLGSQFEDLGRLGSMFCFSESEKASRNPTTLFPHIARDLADLDVNIREELVNAAPTKADRTSSSIKEQFEKLVLKPATAMKDRLHGPIIIIIDALDESGTAEGRRVLLQILASELKKLPPNFRIIITSRPDVDIHKAFLKEPDLVIKRMDDIPLSSTAIDIATYVDNQLKDVEGVDDNMRENIASHASGLFEWARAGCVFIRHDRPGESALSRYEAIINPVRSETSDKIRGDNLLDTIYQTILSKVLPENEENILKIFKFVMARVLGSFEPLSCNSLNEFFRLSRLAPAGCRAESIVGYLGSILSGVDRPDATVAPFHTSFRDFLTSRERSTRFFVDLDNTDIQLDMTWSSLSVMAKELKFNICHLETSHLANKDVTDLDERIKKYISPHLLYACRFWPSHLCALLETFTGSKSEERSASDDNGLTELMKKLEDVLSHRVLYWLEVLSVTGRVDIGVQQMRQVYSWIEKTRNRDEELCSLIEDITQFISYSAKCITRSAPHIYVSALPFTPRRSLMAEKYGHPNNNTLSIAIGKPENYPRCLNMLQGHSSSVNSVAFSPDGSRIISGSQDGTIRVWNAEDGAMALDPFRGHTSSVDSVAFSPDGSRIISGSRDGTIRVWNANDGSMALDPFQAHTDWVSSVAFSPDGSQIVSGFLDGTIRVWNAKDGTMALDPFQGHTSWVNSVAFSPDGSRIVSGSSDCTIRVWNAKDGTMALDPFQAHTYGVNSVAFSPDGSRIVSGSLDHTIRVWNAKDGSIVLDSYRGHTFSVNSVAFSPDSSRIVSGSYDRTIRVWNAKDGTIALDPFQAHTDSVNSVAFSPDGSRIISGSGDRTIRVWHAEDGTMALDPFCGHTDSVNSVAFSSDGSRIISGSYDGTIRVWNAKDGSMALDPFEGHTESVNSVAFSPDGSRIVSGSLDHTIRVWNAKDGTMALDPFCGHTDQVSSVAFSPDGSRIVSGSHDGTIRVWNAKDGTMAFGPFQAHAYGVKSVAFSPDGSRIVSGSGDRTIRVWNAEDGTMALDPFQDHTFWVNSVAFSPDGSRIVSGSLDGTIRVWNVGDGTMALDPFQGHTSDNAVIFSPDGSQVISGFTDGTTRAWHAEDGILSLEPLQAHTDPVPFRPFLPVTRHTPTAPLETLNHQNSPSIPSSSTTNHPISSSALATSANFDALSARDILPQSNWRIEDGWSLGPSGELLFYVPPAHQQCLYGPRTTFVIGRNATKLDMSRFAHGLEWTKAFSNCSTSDVRG